MDPVLWFDLKIYFDSTSVSQAKNKSEKRS